MSRKFFIILGITVVVLLLILGIVNNIYAQDECPGSICPEEYDAPTPALCDVVVVVGGGFGGLYFERKSK